MGEVFNVKDSIREYSIALKILYSTDRNKKSRLINEFKILSKLKHPNLIRVFDIGFLSSGYPYFTMELLNGINLRRFLRDHMNIRFLPEIIKQSLSALYYLQKMHILHGDIKPENIIITNNRNTITTKLVDFGLSQTFTTKTKHIGGTIRFMAPELIINGKHSEATDIYALGISLVESIIQISYPPFTEINDNYYHNFLIKLIDKLSASGLNNPSSISSFIIDLSQIQVDKRIQNAQDAIRIFSFISTHTRAIPKIHTETTFINRKHELKLLHSIINRKLEGETFILEGLRGIGKKCLLNKAEYISQLKGFLILNLKNAYSSHDVFYQFIETISHNLTRDQKSKMLSKHKRIITSLQQNEPRSYNLESSKALFENIVQILHELSNFQLILICFPDIERIEEDFIRFIHHLVYKINIMNSRILILISRNADLSMKTKSYQTYNEICSIASSNIIHINPFKIKNVQNLLLEYFDQELFTKKEINEIMDQTQGIPLNISELIKHLVSKKIIYWQEDIWHIDHRNLTNISIPHNLEETFFSRIEELHQDEITIMRMIAFWGAPIHPKKLSEISGLTITVVNNYLEHLLEYMILIITPEGCVNFGNYFYSHAIIKSTPYPQRKKYQKAIAEYLLTEDKINPIAIANNFIGAGIPDKAVEYGIAAAQCLISNHEFYKCLSLLINLNKLATQKGTKNNIIEVLGLLAPIEYQTGLTNKAIRDYNTLISLTKDDKNKAYFLVRLASIYDELWGQEEKAKILFKDALKFAKRSKDMSLVAEVMIELAEYYGEKRQSIIKKAAELSKEQNINIYARALSKLIYIYKITGKIVKMEKAIKEIDKVYDNLNQITKKQILLKIGTVYFYEGEYKTAKNYIMKKIKLENETDDDLNKIDSLKVLGGICYVEGNYFKMLRVLKEALMLSKIYNDYVASIIILSNMSLAYYHLAEYREVIDCFNTAQAVIKSNQIKKINSIYLIKLASAYQMLGDNTKQQFISNIKKAKKNARRFKNSLGLGHSYLILSIYYLNCLDYTNAIRNAEKALSLFTNLESKDDIAETECVICLIFNERRKTKLSFYHLEQANKIFNDIRCEYLKPLLLRAEGAVARVSGRADALDILNEGLKTSKKMGTREYTWQIQRELALYHKDTGEIHKALSFYKDAIETIKQITESIDGEELKLSYLSVPFRKRVFDEIKALKEELV